MRKTIAVIAFCALLSLTLAACSVGGPGSSSSSGTSSASVSSSTSASASASASSSASAASPQIAAPSTSGKLHVEGTQLVDEHGQSVQLRGASTHGLAWFPAYVNDAFFRELRADWGANVVRLALYTAESGGYCTDGDKAALRKLVDKGVQLAIANDLYVIVDWHILSDNDPNMHADEAEAFFRDISAEYAGIENVLYEICNEPNGATTWDQVKAYAERIIPVIRENDPDAVVIVGTPTWSQDVDKAAADPIAADNVMYTLHFYAATHKDDLRAKAKTTLDAGLPLFVTEFGICDASGNGAIDEGEADEWITFLDEHGVSYVMWNLSNKAESSAMFKATCDKASGFDDADLSQAGVWLKRTLAAEGGNAKQEPSTSGASNSPAAPSSASAPSGGGIEYTATLRDSWDAEAESYFLYDVTIVNNGDAVSSWEIDVPFNADVRLTDHWNGVFRVNGPTVHITNADYNGAIPAGGSISGVGFIVAGYPELRLE